MTVSRDVDAGFSQIHIELYNVRRFLKWSVLFPPNVDLLKIDFSPSETAFQSICKSKHTQIKLK